MGAIWFGLKVGIGVGIGLLLVYFIWNEIRAIPNTALAVKFHKAGFDWAKGPQGWLSRDPNNDDWILWDERNNRMLRATDPGGDWRPSDESLEQCLALGMKYRTLMGF